MIFEKLTFRSVTVRPTLVPLRRPVVSKVGLFDQWPIILIDIETEEGVVGRSYLEPYLKTSVRSIVPVIHDLAAQRKGQPIRPIDDFRQGQKSQSLIGYEGVSMIAVSGLDMAAWDALAKAANMPLAVFLGGSIGPVPAYNSNGLWLTEVDTLAEEARALVGEGGFKGLKLRLGRDRLGDDTKAIEAVRSAVGPDVKLMADFNQGLSLGDALHRCHALDDQGLYWFEEPITYNNLAGYTQLTRELNTPVQLGENFYGPRALQQALTNGAGDYVMPDLMRIGGVTAGCAPQRLQELPASRCPRTCIRSSRRTSSALRKPHIGWNGKIGPTPFLPRRSRWATVALLSPTAWAPASSGTRPP